MPPLTHLLYLHGFRSSPQSTKARKFATWVADNRPDLVWRCPQLPPSPRAAVDDIRKAVEAWPRERMAVIGSSLGGFYATWVAEQTGCPAVLLNPATDPARDLESRVGTTTAWHSDEPFDFRPEFVDELRALTLRTLSHPERILAIIAKGDEVLSWREMVERYRGATLELLEDGDHALSDFDAHLGTVVRFLRLDER